MANDIEGDASVDWGALLGSALTGKTEVAGALQEFLMLQRQAFAQFPALKVAFVRVLDEGLRERALWRDVPFSQALMAKGVLKSLKNAL